MRIVAGLQACWVLLICSHCSHAPLGIEHASPLVQREIQPGVAPAQILSTEGIDGRGQSLNGNTQEFGVNEDGSSRELAQFSQFVLAEEPAVSRIPLVQKCRKQPNSGHFCSTIVSRQELEEKCRQRVKRKPSAKYGFGNVRPRIADGDVLNWEKLRSASLGPMIRHFSHLRMNDFLVLKTRALNEAGCPNNVAIAVASTLEDSLPMNSDPLEIASLYERGGTCIDQSPPDLEMLLTRAGMFYFLGKDFKKAAKVYSLAKDADVPYTGRSLYWLARSYAELGERKEERKITEFMKSRYPFSFHTVVALTSDKKDPGETLKNTANPSKRSQRNPNINSLIEQVELLKDNGFTAAASRVLEWATAESQGTEPEFRLYLAELKKDSTDHLARISLLSGILYRHPQLVTKQSMELYFPKAFYPAFEQNIAGLDPYLLLAVARQESAFNPKARSSANARGLLQVLPRTGKRFKRNPNLFDPSSNIEVGSRYLFELLRRLNGNIPLALASYNAGPERVANWINRYPVENPVLFTDLIPFRETREYVASVMRNYYWYRRLGSQDNSDFVDLVFEAQVPPESQLNQN